MKIVSIVGARPNFVKIAPLLRELRRRPRLDSILVHSGQHYDASLSGQFFEDLDLPIPNVSLGVGSRSHVQQAAEVMRRLEPVLQEASPRLVLVVGDVNSTLAAALTAATLRIPVAHVEAGLRSFDRTMPEELNRIVTDSVSDLLFVTEESGRLNLLREGIPADRIFLVGNVMIDSLEHCRAAWSRSDVQARLGLGGHPYGVVTLHRPSNVDAPRSLQVLLDALAEIARDIPLVFPVHPRTQRQLRELPDLPPLVDPVPGASPSPGLRMVPPLGYLDFMALLARARLVLTDSGGIQEETTALGVPCITLRENTERPVTLTHGTNHLVGTKGPAIVAAARGILASAPPARRLPPLWDGHAASRIVDLIEAYLASPRSADALARA